MQNNECVLSQLTSSPTKPTSLQELLLNPKPSNSNNNNNKEQKTEVTTQALLPKKITNTVCGCKIYVSFTFYNFWYIHIYIIILSFSVYFSPVRLRPASGLESSIPAASSRNQEDNLILTLLKSARAHFFSRSLLPLMSSVDRSIRLS